MDKTNYLTFYCFYGVAFSTFFCYLTTADVGRNVMLTSGCIVGACCQVNTCEVVPENTVVYGSSCIRRVQSEKPQVCTSSVQAEEGLVGFALKL